MSAYLFNITFYSDASLVVARTNDTHTYTVSEGFMDAIWVEEYEYWFDWSTSLLIQLQGRIQPTQPSYQMNLQIFQCQPLMF